MRHCLVVVALIGCASKPTPKPKLCERGAKLELRFVDHQAQYTKDLYKNVREPYGIDPALVADLHADVAVWKNRPQTSDGLPNLNPEGVDYYVYSQDRSALERYLAALPSQPPADHAIRLQYVPPYWRTQYLKEPFLDTRAIAEAVGKPNKPTVRFVLTAEGRETFAKATSANIGNKMAVVIDDVVISAAILDSAIRGGQFIVNQPTQAHADALLAKLACVK